MWPQFNTLSTSQKVLLVSTLTTLTLPFFALLVLPAEIVLGLVGATLLVTLVSIALTGLGVVGFAVASGGIFSLCYLTLGPIVWLFFRLNHAKREHAASKLAARANHSSLVSQPVLLGKGHAGQTVLGITKGQGAAG